MQSTLAHLTFSLCFSDAKAASALIGCLRWDGLILPYFILWDLSTDFTKGTETGFWYLLDESLRYTNKCSLNIIFVILYSAWTFSPQHPILMEIWDSQVIRRRRRYETASKAIVTFFFHFAPLQHNFRIKAALSSPPPLNILQNFSLSEINSETRLKMTSQFMPSSHPYL